MPTNDEIIMSNSAIVNKEIVHFRWSELKREIKCFFIAVIFYIRYTNKKTKSINFNFDVT